MYFYTYFLQLNFFIKILLLAISRLIITLHNIVLKTYNIILIT